MRIQRLALFAALGALACGAAAQVQGPAPETNSTPAKTTARIKGKKATEAQTRLAVRLEEARGLRDDATAITKKLGDLAASGTLPQDPAAIQTMQDMVTQLKGINERLTRIEEEVHGIQGWIEGQNESLPIIQQDVSDLKKTKVSGYVQTQYRDSALTAQNDGFRMRRARMSIAHAIDSRTRLKASFDLVASQFGSTINEPIESTAQVRDAFMTYDINPSDVTVGTEVSAGRMPLPLGYELERSSSDREFPERSLYNQALFAGERSTGVQVKHGLSANSYVHVGVFNALTFNDPQQRTASGPVGDLLATTAGIRYYNKQLNAGISGLFGERFEQVDTANALNVNPTNDREFIYLDASYIGLFDPRIWIRAEAMWGEDRLPASRYTAGNVSRDMEGQQFVIGMNINRANQVSLKWEQFDPNADLGDNEITGWGIAYNHWLNPGLRLTAAFEEFEDKAGEDYEVMTVRAQFKF